MIYNWDLPDWPHFQYNLEAVGGQLLSIAEHSGVISGILKALPDGMKTEALIDIMISEAIKTSEIEGEYFSRQDVMSSIRNQLGLNSEQEVISDKAAEGVGELVFDVRENYDEVLTEEKLWAWHGMVMKGSQDVLVGAWRRSSDVMQVVSGRIDKPTVHFEAPPSARVGQEMSAFIKWFNETAPSGANAIQQPAVRSAVAHLYFESIHPFEDGNGRVGRALSEKALSQGFKRPVLLSLSKAIEFKKKAYYDALQEAQRSNDISSWIIYFVNMVLEAQIDAEVQIEFILKKTCFYDRFESKLNDRQLRVIARMLKEGPGGFKGGMNVRKYIALTKTSKATATRDLQGLLEMDAFIVSGKGRNTAYQIKI